MWHEWNANAGDVMVMLQWACVSHMCMHDAHAIIKMGTLKYSNGLMGMSANSNLRKLTTSHVEVLITQNANENMPNMFLIVFLMRT